MKTKVLNIVIILLAIMAWIIPSPVSAISISPTEKNILAVYVYKNTVELNDWLILVEYKIKYAVLPSETISTTWQARLLSGTTEKYVVSPYGGGYHQGFAKGAIAMYFSASDVTTLGLSWAGAYTMRLDGNPTATWSGSPIPSCSAYASFSWMTSASVAEGQVLASRKILDYTSDIEIDWGTPYVLLETVTVGGSVGQFLTDDGISYMGAVIPNFSTIAWSIIPSASLPANIIDPAWTNDFQTDINTRIAGTIFDLTTMAAQWGISKEVLTSLLWVIVMGIVLVGCSKKVHSYKPAVLLMFPLIGAGVLIGWLPWQVAAVIGFLCGVMTWYTFTLEKSSS